MQRLSLCIPNGARRVLAAHELTPSCPFSRLLPPRSRAPPGLPEPSTCGTKTRTECKYTQADGVGITLCWFIEGSVRSCGIDLHLETTCLGIP